MKKPVAIGLLCLFALLLIAARPRPCWTRSECFYRLAFTATPTSTIMPTQAEISIQLPIPSYNNGSLSTPDYGIATRYAVIMHSKETLLAWMMTQQALIPPIFSTSLPAYPPPVTAPPEGYP